jgi:hypothetical protein
MFAIVREGAAGELAGGRSGAAPASAFVDDDRGISRVAGCVRATRGDDVAATAKFAARR